MMFFQDNGDDRCWLKDILTFNFLIVLVSFLIMLRRNTFLLKEHFSSFAALRKGQDGGGALAPSPTFLSIETKQTDALSLPLVMEHRME